MALREESEQISVRHTSQSHLRLADARDALRIVHTLDEDFATEIEQLRCRLIVSGRGTMWDEVGRATQALTTPRNVVYRESEGLAQMLAGFIREEFTRGLLAKAVAGGDLRIDDLDLAADQFAQLCKADLHDRVTFGLGSGTSRDVARVVEGAVAMFMAR
jgi:hypothetical protein